MNEFQIKSFSLGEIAFKEGKSRTPYIDRNFMALLLDTFDAENPQSHVSIFNELFTSWYEGWDSEKNEKADI